MHWGIFRSATYYPIKMQIRLIMVYFLLHNFIHSEMSYDLLEYRFDQKNGEIENQDGDGEFIETIEATPAWTYLREMTQNIWLAYNNGA